nr:MAG TPA: hypothetical protein [Caudoviricetes sp.]
MSLSLKSSIIYLQASSMPSTKERNLTNENES